MIRSSVQSWAQPGPGGTGRTSFDVTVGVNPGPPRTATLTLLAKWSGDPLRTLTTVQVTQAGFAIIPPANEEISYFHTDAIGSVRMITGATGNVLARYDYLPFGTEWTTSFSTTTNTVKFTGQERDPETANGGWTAQDYFGARSFQNQIGRFTSVDPGHVGGNVGDPQSWNGYAYARNNPLKYVDPTGTTYEICAYGSNGMTSSCGSVSDQYFSTLARSPGAGLRLWGGAIFAGNKVVGHYRQTSVDPTINDFIRLTGALSSRWLREQSTEMAIGAAIAATGGLASGVLGGGLAAARTLGLEAPSMTGIANATARGAGAVNLSVNLTAGEFQANLLKSGYRVLRQGAGTNGPIVVLGKGEKVYTIYRATSSGEAAADVFVRGQRVSKLRLSGF